MSALSCALSKNMPFNEQHGCCPETPIRFHTLQEFDEGKRSCRRRLAGHNKRRRKTNPDSATNANPLSDDQASSYLLISLLKILSNMHSKYLVGSISTACCYIRSSHVLCLASLLCVSCMIKFTCFLSLEMYPLLLH